MWRERWRGLFGEDPSAETCRGMDELSQLCGEHRDDPMVIIGMFLHRQIQLFDDRASRFMLHAGELERASEYIRATSYYLRQCGGSLGALVINMSADTKAINESVGALKIQVDQLNKSARSTQQALEDAQSQLRWENVAWRLDLKLIRATAGLFFVLLFGALVYHTVESSKLPMPMPVVPFQTQ